MKRLSLAVLLLFVATVAFAHAGHVHTLMGTVTMLHDDGSFMMKSTKDETWHIVVTGDTKFSHADDTVATRADMKVGSRVVVKAKDGVTAVSVKLSK